MTTLAEVEHGKDLYHSWIMRAHGRDDGSSASLISVHRARLSSLWSRFYLVARVISRSGATSTDDMLLNSRSVIQDSPPSIFHELHLTFRGLVDVCMLLIVFLHRDFFQEDLVSLFSQTQLMTFYH